MYKIYWCHAISFGLFSWYPTIFGTSRKLATLAFEEDFTLEAQIDVISNDNTKNYKSLAYVYPNLFLYLIAYHCLNRYLVDKPIGHFSQRFRQHQCPTHRDSV